MIVAVVIAIQAIANERKKIRDFNRIKTHGFQFASSFCDDDDCEVESDRNDITCNIYNGDVDDV